MTSSAASRVSLFCALAGALSACVDAPLHHEVADTTAALSPDGGVEPDAGPKPSVRITSPLDGMRFSQGDPIPVHADAHSEEPISYFSVSLIKSGSADSRTLYEGTATTFDNILSVGPGDYTINASAETASAANGFADISFFVAVGKLPQISYKTFKSANPPGKDVMLSTTASDADGYLTTLELRKQEGGLIKTFSCPGPTTQRPHPSCSLSFVFRDLRESLLVQARATDNQGNMNLVWIPVNCSDGFCNH